MTLKIIGAGLGRTGTQSLKQALNALGLGPCHHMDEVLKNRAAQVPLWAAAARGEPDWPAVFEGYASAVDWPTAAFYRELAAAYPNARFVLTVRSAASWVDSFSATIYRLLSAPENFPPEMKDWLAMATRVIASSGFGPGLDAADLERGFEAHTIKVKAAIPQDRLLVFDVKEGWAPLCAFLGVAKPGTPFPRTNDRVEFWDRVKSKQ